MSLRISAGLPTGMEGLTYPIPFSEPETIIRIAQAAEKFVYCARLCTGQSTNLQHGGTTIAAQSGERRT